VRLWLLGGLWWQEDDQSEREDLAPNLNAWVSAVLATLNQPVPRGVLAELLWPELNPGASANALRQRLHRLRQTPLSRELDLGVLLRWTGESDVAAFRGCCSAGDWAGALELYRGPLLHDVPYPAHLPLDVWTEKQRQSLHEEYLHALWQLIRQHQQLGQLQEVVALLHRAQRQAPDAPEIVAELASTYLTLNNRAQARHVIEQYQASLEQELGAELPSSLVSLLARSRVAPPSAAPRAWGLPTFLTSFVGRETERRLALDRLTSSDPANRWLTITGPGGMGKTRLATEVARLYAAQTQHSVYFFSLAPLTTERQVTEMMLQALNEPVDGPAPARQRLFHALAWRPALLILDNFEHLFDVADLLPALLSACPQLRLLVTSRQRLQYQAEGVLRLRRLSEPVGSAGTGDDSGVQLFTERAARADLTFDGSRHTAVIAQIVERCEGVPLAIELAAAWTAVYTPQAVLHHLETSWDFLRTSLRDVSERHHSLRAVFQHSWQLLPGPLQHAYAQLAVFRSPFTVAAARTADVSVADLRLLEQRSLLNTAGAGRYTWHENLRSYALEQLGEALGARLHWHLEYFTTLAEEAAPQLKGSRQTEVLSALATVYPDMQNALAYAVRTDQIGHGLRLAGALHWFWYVRGFFEEGLSWLKLFLEASEAQPHATTAARALALLAAGGLSRERGQGQEAAASYAAALSIFASLSHLEGQAQTYHMQGIIERDQGDYARARQVFELAVVLWQQCGDRQGLATTHNDLGILSAYENDLVAARTSFESSLALKREVGDLQGFSTGQLGFKLRQEQEKAISRGQNTSQRAFLPTESPGQDIPSRNSRR
jgi:predicted ATPase/DNA-binding SARP family transcriptional activator